MGTSSWHAFLMAGCGIVWAREHIGVHARLAASTHLLNGGMCGSKQKIDGGLAEAIQTLDSKVLLVLLGVKQAVATDVTRMGQAVAKNAHKVSRPAY